MTLSDLHTHTHFSFDSEEAGENSCKAAIAMGLSELAITNHCDYDCILSGIYPAYEFEADRAEIAMLKAEYRGKLRVIYGIEAGQPQLYPAALKQMIEAYSFEYVIGSIHNLKDVPDFAFLNFTDMPQRQIESLFGRYLDEYGQMVCCPGITTAAHLTYPLRYIHHYGRELKLEPFYPQIEEVFRAMIRNGVRLEINTSGLRYGLGCTLPDFGLAEMYYACGGRLVTVGSDAHRACDIGAGIAEAAEALRKIGFTQIGI